MTTPDAYKLKIDAAIVLLCSSIPLSAQYRARLADDLSSGRDMLASLHAVGEQHAENRGRNGCARPAPSEPFGRRR